MKGLKKLLACIILKRKQILRYGINKEFDFYLESLLQSYYLEALDNLLYEWALFEKFTGATEDFEEEAYQKM